MLRSLTPLLGCGLMMVVCMAVMGGGRKRRNEPAAPSSSTDEVAELRDEVARLRRLDDQRAATEDPSP